MSGLDDFITGNFHREILLVDRSHNEEKAKLQAAKTAKLMERFIEGEVELGLHRQGTSTLMENTPRSPIPRLCSPMALIIASMCSGSGPSSFVDRRNSGSTFSSIKWPFCAV